MIYENQMPFAVEVSSDGTAFRLGPGDSATYRTRADYFPDHVQAFDEEGNLRFDKVITWEELEANGFRVVIR